MCASARACMRVCVRALCVCVECACVCVCVCVCVINCWEGNYHASLYSAVLFFFFFKLTGLGGVQSPESNEKGEVILSHLVLSYLLPNRYCDIAVAALLNLSLRRYKTGKMIFTELTQMLVLNST